jgi:hypothetical protein
MRNTRMTAYADKMAHDKFDGTQGFSIDGGLKDSRYYFVLCHARTFLSVTLPSHIRRLTSELNSPMPVIDIAHQHMLTARAGHTSKKLQGTSKYETLDWSALVSGVRVAAGLAATGSGSVRHRQPQFTVCRLPDCHHSTLESSSNLRTSKLDHVVSKAIA